jgi:hypothetical protein
MTDAYMSCRHSKPKAKQIVGAINYVICNCTLSLSLRASKYCITPGWLHSRLKIMSTGKSLYRITAEQLLTFEIISAACMCADGFYLFRVAARRHHILFCYYVRSIYTAAATKHNSGIFYPERGSLSRFPLRHLPLQCGPAAVIFYYHNANASSFSHTGLCSLTFI